MKKLLLLLLLCCCLGYITSSFATEQASEVTIATISLASSKDANASQVKKAWKNWALNLQKNIHHPVKIVFTKNVMHAADLLKEGKVSLAYLKPVPAQKLAAEQKGIVPVAIAVGLNGETTYQAILARKCDRQISNIAEFKGQKLGIIKHSMSGNEIAKEWLQKNGLTNQVKLVVFHSHEQELKALMKNEIFAAFTWDGALDDKICAYQTTATGINNPILAANTHYSNPQEIAQWKTALSATPMPRNFWPVVKITGFKSI